MYATTKNNLTPTNFDTLRRRYGEGSNADMIADAIQEIIIGGKEIDPLAELPFSERRAAAHAAARMACESQLESEAASQA